MKKMFFVMLVLLSVSFLISGCVVTPVEVVKCGVLSTPGTYNINDLTPTDPVIPPCVQITGDGITLDGDGTTFTGQIEISGNNNVVTNFASLQPYNESHPAISIVSGTGNEIYSNIIYTNHRRRSGLFTTCTATGGVGVLLDGATGNKIHDNEFVGVLLFDKADMVFCVQGPSILAVNGANSNQIYRNDFHSFTGGVANDGTSSLNAADFCLSGEGNWWTDSITFSSPIIMPWGITNFWKVEDPNCIENIPFVADADLDGVAGRADNCPFQPNGDQQNLDGDGLGTPCDDNEFDINTQNWSSLGFITQTKNFTWLVPKDYIGPTYFLPSTVEVKDVSSIWTIQDQHQYIGIKPLKFGPGSVEVKSGHAGVLYKKYVSGPNNCGGGMVTGPVSLAGVGYAYGFNKSCVDQFKAEGTDKYVEYTIEADPQYWNAYEHWDADTIWTPKIDKTGQNFTIDPYDAQGNFINKTVMSVVFVPKQGTNQYGRAVRLSLPMIGTSGKDLNLSSEQAANFTYYCEKIGDESSNNDAGIESLCHNATEVPRGTDTKYNASKMEFIYNGDGTYTVRMYIPAEFIQQMPEGTHELTIANAVSLAQRDIINRLVWNSVSAGSWPSSRAFKFNSNLHAGSYIPCVGVGKCIFQGTEANPITVNFHVDDVGGLDITDPEVVRNGLGLAIQGKTDIYYTNFVSDNPYIGFAVAPGSSVHIHNSNFDNSILGWVVSNSYFEMEDSSITSASLQDIDQTTVELRDIRSMLLYQNGNESWWSYEDENGVDVDFTISTDILQGGLQAQTNLNLPPVQSGLNLGNIVVNAGELNGILIVSDYTQEPIMLNNVALDARQGITIVGTSQDPAKVLDVDIVNLDAHTQQCGIIAGASDVSVTGGECNGYTATENDGSFTGWAVLMSGRGYADEQLNIYHTMDELDNYWVRSFTMTDHTITNHGTHPTAANYGWADKAVVVRDEKEGDPFKGAGTTHFENVVATLDGVAQPIAAYGEPTITTAGTVPPIEYPGACTGNSHIHAKVTSNDVVANGAPGQQPLDGATVKAYDKDCAVAYSNDAQYIFNNCDIRGSCLTGEDGVAGECTVDCLLPGDYFVLVDAIAYSGKYPSHSVGYVAEGETKKARFAFLSSPDGKVSPGKSKKQSGSELWIYQPDYIVWEGTEEYYPFVFESDSGWTIDVCIDAPTGYEPADGVECVQTLVANEAKSILFELIEVGSVPGPVGVDINMVDPHGKKQKYHSEVGMRVKGKLRNKLEENGGMAFDKNGRLLGKGKGKGFGLTGAAITEGAGSVLAIVLVIAVLTLIGVGYLLNKNKKQPKKKK